MLTISADEMQRDLPNYLRLVQSGETLLITQADEPIAQMQAVASALKEPRPFGLAKDEFRVPDDFDAPLPDEILDGFEGA